MERLGEAGDGSVVIHLDPPLLPGEFDEGEPADHVSGKGLSTLVELPVYEHLPPKFSTA